MKILPVNIFNPQRTEKNPRIFPGVSPQNYYQDTVSFTSSIMNGKDFKKLSRLMVDLYTGEPMLSGRQLNKMKKRGFFKGPISEVVRKLGPYKKKYLESVEFEVFEQIEKAAETTPDLTLPQLFTSLYKSTRSNFRKLQKPSFDEIKTLGAQLPPEYTGKFFRFMQVVDRKLYDEPIRQEFSQKEFSYKVRKTVEKLSDVNFSNRLNKFLSMLESKEFSTPDKPLPSKLIKVVFDFKNMDVQGKKSAYYVKHLKPYETDKDSVRKEIIKKMAEEAATKGYKRFEKLCRSNLAILNEIPIRVPFNNKVFVYDLAELLQDLPDSPVKQKMFEVAYNLPSSSKNADALILKFKDADADVIGDRLFNPALASIEHIKPQSEGGRSVITNYALAKKRLNSDRLSMPLWEFLKRFPVKNQYKYADKLVKLNHRKKMKYEDALGQMKALEREGKLDLKAYKQKLIQYEEDKFIQMLKRKFDPI